MSNVKPWMRTQENWVLSVAPDVLAAASSKLCHRLGLQALTYGSTVEGFGLGARGREGSLGAIFAHSARLKMLAHTNGFGHCLTATLIKRLIPSA